MKFKDLKKKYQEYDMLKNDDCGIIIGDFLINESGSINISRSGSTNEGIYLSVYTSIAKDRTIEQLEMFIKSIL